MVLEKVIEQRTCHVLKAKGFISIKLVGLKGIPDRLFIAPNGFMFFVEFKSETGKLSPHQIWWHEKLKKQNCTVLTIRSRAELTEWIAENL